MQKQIVSLVALMFLVVRPIGSQVSGSHPFPKSHALGPQVKLFNNYSKDFEAMSEPLHHGEELEILQFLDQAAKTAEDRLYALDAELRMYDTVSCKTDRDNLRTILKGQLEYNSWAFDSEVTRVTGGLTFTKIPASAQTGLRMKDDLRAAKEKLDVIAASLD